MSLPAYDGSPWAALLLGLLFGLALEGAGFASPRKLTGQFTLRDFTVLKVMFTAVVVAAAGLWLAEMLGAIAGPRAIFIHTPYYWAFALGGALIGAGFAVGGYCPGTAAVGLAGGRLDALVFIAGMVVGIGLFAGGFQAIEPLYTAAEGQKAQRVDALVGVPAWLVILALAAAVAAVFRVGGVMERRRGGPYSAADIAAPDGSRPPAGAGPLGASARSPVSASSTR